MYVCAREIVREREKERERVSECLRQFSPSRFLGLRCHGNYFSQHVAAKPAEDCTYFDKVVVTSTMNKGKREKERRESENRRGEGEGRRKRQVGPHSHRHSLGRLFSPKLFGWKHDSLAASRGPGNVL